jgi:hypothetical protein
MFTTLEWPRAQELSVIFSSLEHVGAVLYYVLNPLHLYQWEAWSQ